MPYFYKVEKNHRVVLSTASAVFSREDFRSHQEKLKKDPDFDPTYAQIADFSHVTRFDLSHADLEQMAQGTIFDLHARSAIIAPNDVGYDFGRLYESLRKSSHSEPLHGDRRPARRGGDERPGDGKGVVAIQCGVAAAVIVPALRPRGSTDRHRHDGGGDHYFREK